MNPKGWFLRAQDGKATSEPTDSFPFTFFFMTPASKGIAVVTGSAGALGKAIASQLAQYGYNIALNDISTKNDTLEALAEDIRKKGRKAIVVVGDVTVEKDVKNLIETTAEKLGGLDVVSTTNRLVG